MKKLIKTTHTGKWVIENYPSPGRTFSYIHELLIDDYHEKRGKVTVFSSKNRFGKAYYMDGDMNTEQRALFMIAGTAMNTLTKGLE